jgi:hypothetical protein
MENILGGITIPSHRSAIDFTKPSTRKSPWNPCPSKGQQEPFKQVLEYRLASGNFYSPHWTSIIEPRLCEEQRAGTSEQNMKDYGFLGRSLAIESVVPCIRIEISGSGDPPIEETSATELLTEDEVILPYRKYESIDWKQVHQYVSFRYKRFPPTAIVLSIAEGGRPGGRDYSFLRLTHFLIDGHHKMMAAAKFWQPIQILSFFHQQETRVPLKLLRVRHEQEYSGKRLSHEESARLWCLRQQQACELS